ncbi:MAG: BrnT family toxin [bacterium]
MRIDKKSKEFIWDRGNIDKNWIKHKVKNSECEEIFFDENKVVLKDALHSGKEERSIVLGKTKKNRLLFVVFTKRGDKIRVISTRDTNRKERRLYEEAT